jgi:glycosyltransferase involved in cell wall biosynthesis
MRAYDEAGYDVTGISAPGRWVGEIEAAGVRHIPISTLRRSWAPLSDLRAFVELIRLFRRERFDIVHTHAPKTGVLGRIAARLTGVPVVVNTVHGLYGTDGGALRRAVFLFLERIAAKCSDFEFCQSSEDLDTLRRLRIVRPDRSMAIGNGVDLTVFDRSAAARAATRAALGVDNSTLIIGSVGRMVWEKGYREIFAAAERIHATHPKVCWIVAGPIEGDKADAIPPDLIADLDRRGVIKFLGLRTDMRDLYAAMDLYVLASYREGYPRSAVEAAVMGLPLIVTEIRGCRELVAHERNGLLVPPRDAEALEAAVRRLVDDVPLRERLATRNRLDAPGRFDERRIIASVLDVYDRLRAERGLGHAAGGLNQKSVAGR